MKKNKFKKLITTIAVFILMIFISFWIWRPSGAEAAWFDDSFAYRNSIPISSHTAAENNVYISATIDTSTSGQFQADCGDLRFTDYAGNQLPYYISSGCASASTVVHVFFDTMPAGAQTIYYYYGNPSATNGFNTAGFATQATSYVVGSVGSQEKGGAPVAYWKFDEGTGTTTIDSSSNKFTGTLTNGPTWQTEDQCITGKCLKFDGTNDFINAGNIGNYTNISVSFWVNLNSISASGNWIIGKDEASGRSYAFGVGATGLMWSQINGLGGSQTDNSKIITANTWYHLSYVYDGTDVLYYINGKRDGRNNFSVAINSTATNLNIGRRSYSGSESYINALVDDVRIYNYARTAAQIKADYAARGQQKGANSNLGSSSKNLDALSNGLVGYWKMDEASGNALDASGNSNTGVATGTTVVTGKFGNGRSTPASNYLTVTSATSLNFTSTTTHAIWIYPTSWPGAGVGRIFGRTDYSLDIAVDSAGSGVCGQGKIAIYTPSSSWKCTNYQLSLNTWYHAVFVFDGSYWKLYINGELAWTNSSTSTINISTNLYLGTTPADYAQNFLGTMDEVRIYNRTLSPKEIRDLYNWAPGPIAYWNMDEKTGTTIKDNSGNNLTSSAFSGNTSWVSGKYGGALNLDGTGDYVDIPDNALFDLGSKDWTTSVWINNSSIPSQPAVISIGPDNGGVVLTIYNNKPYIYWNSAGSIGTSGQTTFTTNQWYYVTITKSSTSIRTYINGILEDTDTVSGTQSTTNGLTIGDDNHSGTDFDQFNGKLDDIRIYDYARTQKQIVEDMNGSHPAGGSPVGSQVGYWKFDEGYGTTANNSGNGGSALNGTITGATWNNNGKFGKALNFDGVNDSISKSSPSGLPTGSSARTISLWMNPTNTNPGGVLVHYGDGPTTGQEFILVMQTISGSTYLFTDGDNGSNNLTVSGSEIPASGQWSHIVFTVDSSSNWKYYLNGKYTKGGTFAVAINTVTPTSLDIGVREGSTGYFPGMLDEVKIYNYALTSDEVQLDYNKGAAMALGSLSDTSGLTGGSSASSSATASYCVPGSTDTCTPPVAEWNFEEGVGTTAYDNSGNSNTGTLAGAWAKGKIGKAVDFTATTDNVNGGSGTTLDNLANKTIEGWIYPRSFTNNAAPRIVDKTWLLSLGTTGYLNFNNGFTGNGIFTSPTGSLALDAWQHFAITYNNSSTSSVPIMYINGKSVTVTTSTPPTGSAPDESASSLILGNNAASGGVRALSGMLDQIRVFNYIRTPAQIAWDYNRGLPITHLKMDECQGNTLNDSSGNGNSPTISIGGTGTQTAVGTCTSSGAWYNGATGKFNSSLNFDGTDDTASKTSPANLPSAANPFTTSLWLKSTSGTSNLYILKWGTPSTKTMNAIIYYGGTSSVSHAFYAADLNSGANTVTSGSWNHVLVTWDGTTRRIYINSKEKNSDTPTSINVTANQTLYVASYAGSSNYFPGQLDDIRIYNYALTGTQVKQVYNEGSGIRFGS